jgi:hypothetical protein
MQEQKLKEIITPQKMMKNIEEIVKWLTRDGSKFREGLQVDELHGPMDKHGKQKPLRLVKGYMSKFMTVFVDSKDLTVTVYTNPMRAGGGRETLVTTNQLMVKNPVYLYEFLKEQQAGFERAFANMNKKGKR